MKRLLQKFRLSFVLTALLVALPMVTLAETTECTVIDSIPIVISQQGVYCLKGNLATDISTGNAIDVQANNVTIDLNGFKLGGLAAGVDTDAFGIYAIDRQNLVVKNGNIRGFRYGIRIVRGVGHLISNNNLDGNFESAIWFASTASGIIDGNVITGTGGRTANATIGIMLKDGDIIVRDNVLSKLTNADANTYFIKNILISGTGSKNIFNNTINGTSEAKSIGIESASVERALIYDNVISSLGDGMIVGDATFVLKNNLIDNCITDYDTSAAGSYVDAGGNYPIVP